MLARTPDLLDVMVGARIRILRNHRGMSQGELAGKIGVTFQQVQKYEKGTNRVGAGRLSRIAAGLGVSVGDAFEQLGDSPPHAGVGGPGKDLKNPQGIPLGQQPKQ